MGVNFTPQEGSALYRLLAENTSDIILKTDREGFVLHASPAIERLGFSPLHMLIGPHLLDLVGSSCADAIRAEHDAVVAGRGSGTWIEFRARTRDGSERWSEIHMRSLGEGDDIYGVLSIVRCIEERRSYEEKLFAATMTDPLTGLTNRRAFIAMLQHLVDERADGCLALFDVDHFRSINLHYGHATGDEVLVVFAELVRTLMRRDDTISRIGNESIGVLLPGASLERASGICQRIVDAMADTRRAARAEGPAITASAGLARLGETLDDTIKRAELALFFAKAKGGNRLERDSGQSPPRLPGGKSW